MDKQRDLSTLLWAQFQAREVQLKGVFQSALTFSLAMQTTALISKNNNNNILIIIPICIIILYMFLAAETIIDYIVKEKMMKTPHPSISHFFIAPTKHIVSLLSFAVTILTQFIGTLFSGYVTQLPPHGSTADPVTEIIPIALMTLIFFLIAQQAYSNNNV